MQGDVHATENRDPTPVELQPLFAAVLEANSMWERQRDVEDLEDYYTKAAELWTAARAYFIAEVMDSDEATATGREG